jgi:hypothetical protein
LNFILKYSILALIGGFGGGAGGGRTSEATPFRPTPLSITIGKPFVCFCGSIWNLDLKELARAWTYIKVIVN